MAVVAGIACLLAAFGIFAGSLGNWRAAAPMPLERTEVATVTLGGKIYVTGGGVRPRASKSGLNEVFDPGP